MPFLFEGLDVYQKSLDWIEQVEDLAAQLKGKTTYSILDQLSRASSSISLNIAEGNGRWHLGDRRQFFWIARGSVFECVPILQVFHRKKLVDENTYQTCYGKLEALAKMLTKLISSLENLKRSDNPSTAENNS